MASGNNNQSNWRRPLAQNAAGAARTTRSTSSGRGGLSAGANQRTPNSNSSTPTAASRGRHVNAAPSPVASFGTTAPRMPALSTKASPRETPAAITVGSSGDPSSERVHEESPLPSSLDHSMSTLTSSSSDERQELRSQDGSTGEAEGPVTQGPCDLPPHLEYTPLDNDSMTVALSPGEALKEYQPFFKGAGKVIDVLEGKSLSESVRRMHGASELSDGKEYDPLLDYGAEHLNFVWTSLSDAIALISQHDPTQVVLLPVADLLTQERFFCLNLELLALVAHTIIAGQQILDALTRFLSRKPSSSFVLDKNYEYLRLLEKSASKQNL
ncbi:hypothetical protein DFH07DRAFT_967298 [Mycena maculata]|uniref:Uncharacterized protein n=1 Tax=Mycena maculata TaxID=230809 RepID=A0AAD7I533_9AGAR|nr:hypothetical protein DFH07DRAFT_967298 [Mycena maculata]